MLVIGMLFSTGCFVVPEEEVEPEVSIICEGGHYQVFPGEWQSSSANCDGDPVYSAGTYWVNADGRMFLLGDPIVVIEGNEVFIVYGKCPTEFIEEILFEEVE